MPDEKRDGDAKRPDRTLVQSERRGYFGGFSGAYLFHRDKRREWTLDGSLPGGGVVLCPRCEVPDPTGKKTREGFDEEVAVLRLDGSVWRLKREPGRTSRRGWKVKWGSEYT
jgi:hypothetical protein